MRILRALDAGFTAFCNELWLPTLGFHLFDDPADALEDVPVELAGSLGAPGDKSPEEVLSPEAASSGHPLTKDDVRQIIREEFDWLRQIAGEAYEELRQALK